MISFRLGDVLHTVHGTFKLTNGELWFDSSTSKAGGRLIVAAGSGDTGSHARDSRMNKNVLKSDRFTDITFSPDRIDGKVDLTGDSAFQLHGLFGIHGVTHELTTSVKSHFAGNRLNASSTFDVPYVKWGLKDPSTLFLKVNNTVQIQIETAGSVSGR